MRIIENIPTDFHRGRKIFDTNHSLERLDQRYIKAGIDKQDILVVIKRAMDKIFDRYNDQSDMYGVHSKSTGIGAIINWREERRNSDGNNHAILVTLLPPKKYHKFKDSDVVLIVESLFERWGRDQAKKEKCRIYESEGAAVHFDIEDFSVVFYEGEYYDTTLDIENFIIVE